MKSHSKAQFKKTFLQRKEDVTRQWFVFDAAGKTLGRFCSEIANVLRGKHKPEYTPYVDCGDGVIVINADQIRLTGNKVAQKVYRRYTGYIGGLRETDFLTQMEKDPTFVITHAVKGMLPRKSRLTRKQMTRLRVFAKDKHNMEAQKPVTVNI